VEQRLPSKKELLRVTETVLLFLRRPLARKVSTLSNQTTLTSDTCSTTPMVIAQNMPSAAAVDDWPICAVCGFTVMLGLGGALVDSCEQEKRQAAFEPFVKMMLA